MRLLFWRTSPEDQAAVERAERERDEVRSRWPEVHEKAAAIRRHAEVNGFTEMIRVAMGVGRK